MFIKNTICIFIVKLYKNNIHQILSLKSQFLFLVYMWLDFHLICSIQDSRFSKVESDIELDFIFSTFL